MVKFSSKMDPDVLESLRKYSEEQGQTLSYVLTEAAKSYLESQRVRPTFKVATAEVLGEHAELLGRLAK